MAKKTKTPAKPRIDCRPESTISGSCISFPSAMKKECEKITVAAANTRSASKLLARE